MVVSTLPVDGTHIFDTLPNHEFYQSAQSDLDHHSLSQRSASLSSRKLSRKLPPKWTESLEDLALGDQRIRRTSSDSTCDSASPPQSPSSPSGTFGLPTVNETPRPSLPAQQHILQVDMPSSSYSSSGSSSEMVIHSHIPSLKGKATPRKQPSLGSIFRATPSHLPPPSQPLSHRPSTSSTLPSLTGSASTAPSTASGAWSILDEVTANGRSGQKESRKVRKARKKAEEEAFDVEKPPTTRELFEASLLEVIDEEGERIRFGDLVRGRKTIVIFIRHWFCPLCAQYMNSIISTVPPSALEAAGVSLIIIGNGSHKMLSAYRNKAFKCPYKMYTDPTLALYRALGLTRQTGDAGPDSEKGEYLVQTALESTVQTLKRATVMPLRNPGHFLQLGGEFVFNGTLEVSWTHRMRDTRSHWPIKDVCAEAGVQLEFIHFEPGPQPPPVHRNSCEWECGIDGEGAGDWQGERERQLSRIREMRRARREGWGAKASAVGERGRGEVRIVSLDEELGEVEGEFGQLGFA